MKWATRACCHIDRAACAWLIRRFLDQEARFIFIQDPDELPADATPFDMRGAVLSHHDGDCSFETILRHYQLQDPGLTAIARIVHEADLGDERYDAPEAAGLDMLMRGLQLVRSDEEVLALSAVLFDGLYAYCSATAGRP
ncbi:MAG TPA: chromate resistance protein ChrB domain-containing protein [Dehalococcoidia bacterium]|nr:chromate resistance protein ChrB domain-containing protein [Dehalococcoidia bacterium]